MNSRRRAELQRKLTLNVVPRPPADLGAKIKSDITRHLLPHDAPQTRSIAFNLRIAASVIVLISSVLGAIVFMTPEAEKGMATTRPQPRSVPTLTLAVADDTTASQPAAEARMEVADASAMPQAIVPPPAAPRPAAAPSSMRERTPERDSGNSYAPELASSGFVGAETPSHAQSADGDSPAAMAGRMNPRETMAEAAPAAPPSQAAGMARGEATAKAIEPRDAAPAFAQMSRGASMQLATEPSAFGVSLDRDAFNRIRTAIENGSRPAPESVDVEAVVNYFAGPAERAPRQGLRLDVEASPAAVAAEGDRAILRITIDAARMDLPRGAANAAPAARDAAIDVTIDANAVAHFRRVGDGSPLTTEAVLRHNTSVTALYELELTPRLKASQHLATVRLTWISTDGKRKTVERRLTAGDLARDWRRATRRHRLASLGAVWGETLKGSGRPAEVARRAAELAEESPGNIRARELAEITSAP